MTRYAWVVRDELGTCRKITGANVRSGAETLSVAFDYAITGLTHEWDEYTDKEVARLARMHGWTCRKEAE